MSQAVSELPWPHRDELAFLTIRLQTVTQSPNAKMNVASPAQVFGPATAAHAVPNPDPVTMFWDIKCQLKVGENLFFLPLESWNQFAMVVHENIYTQRGHGNSAWWIPD